MGHYCTRFDTTVISDLKTHMPGYEKGAVDTYSATKDSLEAAITNAKKIAKHCEDAVTDMPSTKMHELVECLQNLRK